MSIKELRNAFIVITTGDLVFNKVSKVGRGHRFRVAEWGACSHLASASAAYLVIRTI